MRVLRGIIPFAKGAKISRYNSVELYAYSWGSAGGDLTTSQKSLSTPDLLNLNVGTTEWSYSAYKPLAEGLKDYEGFMIHVNLKNPTGDVTLNVYGRQSDSSGFNKNVNTGWILLATIGPLNSETNGVYTHYWKGGGLNQTVPGHFNELIATIGGNNSQKVISVITRGLR